MGLYYGKMKSGTLKDWFSLLYFDITAVCALACADEAFTEKDKASCVAYFAQTFYVLTVSKNTRMVCSQLYANIKPDG